MMAEIPIAEEKRKHPYTQMVDRCLELYHTFDGDFCFECFDNILGLEISNAIESATRELHDEFARERKDAKRWCAEQVTAETERCAKVFPESIECPLCREGTGKPCISVIMGNKTIVIHPHATRWSAAIRALQSRA
jgi:hypothetical protein